MDLCGIEEKLRTIQQLVDIAKGAFLVQYIQSQSILQPSCA